MYFLLFFETNKHAVDFNINPSFKTLRLLSSKVFPVDEISDITSPSLLLAFTMLGLFPLVTKKVLKYIRKDKGDE